mmetsp:Transcript_85969/g.256416  ORF Transcript_85969/g.256416 Transcript_85969/m.256416 type:complete len:217 (+) Transcript_85969:572-1222(+)
MTRSAFLTLVSASSLESTVATPIPSPSGQRGLVSSIRISNHRPKGFLARTSDEAARPPTSRPRHVALERSGESRIASDFHRPSKCRPREVSVFFAEMIPQPPGTQGSGPKEASMLREGGAALLASMGAVHSGISGGGRLGEYSTDFRSEAATLSVPEVGTEGALTATASMSSLAAALGAPVPGWSGAGGNASSARTIPHAACGRPNCWGCAPAKGM